MSELQNIPNGCDVQFEVLTTSLSRPSTFAGVDLTDERARDAFLCSLAASNSPKVIINCAAERRPDKVETNPSKARALNVSLPTSLGAWCKERGAFMVHISSDYVFDGRQPPYSPQAQPNPLQAYGQMKLESEISLLGADESAFILRVPVLYGDTDDEAESAVTALAAMAKDSSGEKMVDDWSVRYPTHVKDVASVLRQIVEKRLQEEGNSDTSTTSTSSIWKGTHHWSSNEEQLPGVPWTKYTITKVIAQILRLPTDHLKPDSGAPAGAAPRPQDCHLDSSWLRERGVCPAPTETALAEGLSAVFSSLQNKP